MCEGEGEEGIEGARLFRTSNPFLGEHILGSSLWS